MAAHVRLKNEFTEDEKNYNLMSWLNYSIFGGRSIFFFYFMLLLMLAIS